MVGGEDGSCDCLRGLVLHQPAPCCAEENGFVGLSLICKLRWGGEDRTVRVDCSVPETPTPALECPPEKEGFRSSWEELAQAGETAGGKAGSWFSLSSSPVGAVRAGVLSG